MFWAYILGVVVTAVLVRLLPTLRNRRIEAKAAENVKRCGRAYHRVEYVPSWASCIFLGVVWPMFLVVMVFAQLGRCISEGLDALMGD